MVRKMALTFHLNRLEDMACATAATADGNSLTTWPCRQYMTLYIREDLELKLFSLSERSALRDLQATSLGWELSFQIFQGSKPSSKNSEAFN